MIRLSVTDSSAPHWAPCHKSLVIHVSILLKIKCACVLIHISLLKQKYVTSLILALLSTVASLSLHFNIIITQIGYNQCHIYKW